jgi:tRNA pseudouridine55 synthase
MNSRQPSDVPAALLIDKSAGPTSHDLVQQVRREYGVKAGHAGTLDPFATGLMICLLGRATRLQRYLLGLPKRYEATARLGWRSSTGDPTGELTETGMVPASLELPTGTVIQRLPMTSAVRVDGERLYKRAHRGEEIETPERETQVYRADLLENDGQRARYEIECAAGTYVRTLVETLSDAYCEELRRTAIGEFRVPAGAPVPLSAGDLLAFMPERRADEEEADKVGHGSAIDIGELDPNLGGDGGSDRVRITTDSEVLAVARLGDEGELRPEVVLV